MPLDVYLQDKPGLPRVGDDYRHVCSFRDDEGYYWFLHPLFEELRADTGEYIDLYGGAVFKGDALGALARTVAAARVLVDAQPDQWDVVIGIKMAPEPEEIHTTVEKKQMLNLLSKLEEAVSTAKAVGAYVTFWGD